MSTVRDTRLVANKISSIHLAFPPNGNVEVLVIGAGMSGLQFARDYNDRCAGRVWVVEAGPNCGLKHLNWHLSDEEVASMWQMPHLDPSFHRPWHATTPPHYSATSGLRRRLGGRSLYWGGAILRVEPWALCEPWWPASAIQALTERNAAGSSLYESIEAEIGPVSVTPESELLTQVLRSSGRVEARPLPMAVKYRHLPDGTVRWAAYSPLDYWRTSYTHSGSKGRSLPQLVCNTEVQRVMIRNGRVEGVRILDTTNGSMRTIGCGRVVLAAGALENARLALDALLEVGALNQPELFGLTDHLIAVTTCRLRPDSIPEEWARSQIPSFGIMLGNESSRFNTLVSIRLDATSKDCLLVDAWTIGEQLPEPHNYVFVDPAEPAPRALTAHGRFSEEDLQRIDEMRDSLDHLVHSLHMTLDAKSPIEDLTTSVMPLGATEHEGSLLRYGYVTDEFGAFPAVQGLYAIGPSVFPRMGAANPSLTTLALARHTAQSLR